MVSQINFCTFSQQTVIKKDPLVPSNDANLSVEDFLKIDSSSTPTHNWLRHNITVKSAKVEMWQQSNGVQG